MTQPALAAIPGAVTVTAVALYQATSSLAVTISGMAAAALLAAWAMWLAAGDRRDPHGHGDDQVRQHPEDHLQDREDDPGPRGAEHPIPAAPGHADPDRCSCL